MVDDTATAIKMVNSGLLELINILVEKKILTADDATRICMKVIDPENIR